MVSNILTITCLHVLSDLSVDRLSGILVGVPHSSWYDAHFLFAPNLTRGFSSPLPNWLRVWPDPLADRWPAIDLASEMHRITPCIATHQSTIMARGWRARRYRSPQHLLR
jgi:hypothetical protein